MILRLQTTTLILLSSILHSTSYHNAGKQEEDPHPRLSVESKGYISIPIDSVSLNYSTYPYYIGNDTADYYITGNEIINAVDFLRPEKEDDRWESVEITPGNYEKVLTAH